MAHTQTQIKAFLDELKSQTDRGAAVIASAVLDDLLKQLLVARFVELGTARREALFDKINAPLSSFSAKIEMGFAIGAYGNDIRLALHLLRDVRNEFAHRMEQITFDHPDVAGKIQTRAFEVLRKLRSNNRDIYTDQFSLVASLIYATLGAGDIRVPTVMRTYAQYFRETGLRFKAVAEEGASKQPKEASDSA